MLGVRFGGYLCRMSTEGPIQSGSLTIPPAEQTPLVLALVEIIRRQDAQIKTLRDEIHKTTQRPKIEPSWLLKPKQPKPGKAKRKRADSTAGGGIGWVDSTAMLIGLHQRDIRPISSCLPIPAVKSLTPMIACRQLGSGWPTWDSPTSSSCVISHDSPPTARSTKTAGRTKPCPAWPLAAGRLRPKVGPGPEGAAGGSQIAEDDRL